MLIVSIKLCPRPPLSGLISSALLLFYSPALFLFSESNLIMKRDVTLGCAKTRKMFLILADLGFGTGL